VGLRQRKPQVSARHQERGSYVAWWDQEPFDSALRDMCLGGSRLNDLVQDIYNAAKEVSLWPRWKRDIAGIESDYTITKLDFSKLEKYSVK